MTKLPENYRDLQKLAGEVPEASGKGTKEEIRKSLEDAPDEQVEKALNSGDEEPNKPEKQKSDSKEKEKESNQDEKTSEVEKSREEGPELEYSGERDHDGDLFGRKDPEETVTASENEDGEIVLGEEDEEQEKTEDEEPSDVEKPETEIELEGKNLGYMHIAFNQLLSKLLERRGIEVAELDEEDLVHLQRNTKVVANEKLNHEQKKRFRERSGIAGIIIGHGKKVLEGFIDDSSSKEKNSKQDENTSEEEAEHLENYKTEDSKVDDETEGPKFGDENPFGGN